MEIVFRTGKKEEEEANKLLNIKKTDYGSGPSFYLHSIGHIWRNFLAVYRSIESMYINAPPNALIVHTSTTKIIAPTLR